MSLSFNKPEGGEPPRVYDDLLASVISRIEKFQPTSKTASVSEIVRDALGPINAMLDRGGTEDDVARILTEEGVPAKAEAVRTARRRAKAKAPRSEFHTAASPGDLLSDPLPTQEGPIRPQDGASIGRHLD